MIRCGSTRWTAVGCVYCSFAAESVVERLDLDIASKWLFGDVFGWQTYLGVDIGLNMFQWHLNITCKDVPQNRHSKLVNRQSPIRAKSLDLVTKGSRANYGMTES